MPLIRPRLTDFHDLGVSQSTVDFAIPFLDEDLPLFLDPFLLWKSPSLQDQSLHGAIVSAFNRLGNSADSVKFEEAAKMLVRLSECDEVGLGSSARRIGKRIGEKTAREILALFAEIPSYSKVGFRHFEEIQLYIEAISKDRVSDIACNLLKSFLIDYTIEQCEKIGLPRSKTRVAEVYDHQKHQLTTLERVELPINPINGSPLLLVPKRWLRHSPWIAFDDYFNSYIPKDDKYNSVVWDRVTGQLTRVCNGFVFSVAGLRHPLPSRVFAGTSVAVVTAGSQCLAAVFVCGC